MRKTDDSNGMSRVSRRLSTHMMEYGVKVTALHIMLLLDQFRFINMRRRRLEGVPLPPRRAHSSFLEELGLGERHGRVSPPPPGLGGVGGEQGEEGGLAGECFEITITNRLLLQSISSRVKIHTVLTELTVQHTEALVAER
jgi:hypothetical protein